MTDRSTFSNLQDWRTLLAVADTGSISRAALELDCHIAQVSRSVSSLEKRIGIEIFDRSTRPFRLTPTGEEVIERLRPLMREWQSFEDFIVTPESPVKLIRLSTPVGIGRFYLNDQIAEYRRLEPGVTIEATIEEGPEAVLDGRIDVAFIPYRPVRSDLIIYPAMSAFTLPLASAAYIRKYGSPQKPEDLRRHIGILKTGVGFPAADHLIRRGERQSILWKRVIRHNDMLNVKDAVLKGFGIAVDIPLGMVLDELRSGELVPVLNGWHRDYWHYSVITRLADGPSTRIGRFAAWYAERATAEIDARRREGFAILGLREEAL